ncbi:hypothetical protein AAC387_Pa08g1033 [Persea americana]
MSMVGVGIFWRILETTSQGRSVREGELAFSVGAKVWWRGVGVEVWWMGIARGTRGDHMRSRHRGKRSNRRLCELWSRRDRLIGSGVGVFQQDGLLSGSGVGVNRQNWDGVNQPDWD